MVPELVTDRRSSALTWAQNGFYVFPTRGKIPLTPRGFYDATRDPDQITAWWTQFPAANIAIDCGRSNVVVVDVDVKKGAQGRASIGRFLERSQAFQETFLVTTPSGGDHYYFRGSYKGEKHPFGPGVDVQGQGAYVLVPPSEVASQYDDAGNPVPGSERPYVVTRAAGIVDFPFEIVPSANDSTVPEGWVSLNPREYQGPERASVPYGEHRQALWWITWHLRSVHGLSVEAALPIVRAFIGSGVLEGYNPKDPFRDSDLRTLLAGAKPNLASAPPPSAALVDAIVPCRTVLSEKPPHRRQFIPGLVHQGKLHVYYGESGIGKTTIVAYELAAISRMGYDVLAFVSEDSPYDFASIYALSGGDIDRLCLYKQNVRELLLPKDKQILEQIVAQKSWGAVYFDSILDIRSTGSRDNAANAARDLFAPVSELAERFNVAIICTTHTNRAGTFEGSAQIRAKCRMFGRVHRPQPIQPEVNDDGTITLSGKHDPKYTTYVTNEKAQRGKKQNARYAFFFDLLPSYNAVDGKRDMELDDEGALVPVEHYVCIGHEETTNTDLPPEPPATAARIPERPDLIPKIREMMTTDPKVTIDEICRVVGARKSTVCELVREIRKTL